ncbi:ADYC domain-containing protein [Polyangium aurulentum]|uniref:ADYC domain-containing protein n=1 Tax=Polyangium aurulentum TaxID=2567896 RepID=UPI0010AE1547|nr:ADYC domain-containing protein [Polyangium aurulentum]UQA55054.1 pentapeptide repeat-containing protein [Polyangium aurulentum]
MSFGNPRFLTNKGKAARIGSILCIALGLGGCTSDKSAENVLTSAQELNAKNGLQLNGVQLNGVQLNGVQLNGVQLNGVQLNGVQLNGTQFTTTTATGQILTGAAFVGAIFTGALSNGGTITVRIDDMVPSPQPDVFLYGVSYLSTANTWTSLCGKSPSGAPIRAIPLSGTWDATSGGQTSGMHIDDPNMITLACRGYAISKCVEMGYRPWVGVQECVAPGNCQTIPGRQFHQTCTRMIRADYCGDGVPHTKDGMAIDVWDAFGIQSSSPVDWDLEAEWTPTGARCIEHTRLGGGDDDDDGDDNSTFKYITATCPNRLAERQPQYDCGGKGSTMYTNNGFSVPFIGRTLIVNESNNDSDDD